MRNVHTQELHLNKYITDYFWKQIDCHEGSQSCGLYTE